MNEDTRSFAEVKERLDAIVDEVSREDISLDDALTLYEEAVKLGLGACNLSENDIFPEEIEAVEEADAPDAPNADDQGETGAAPIASEISDAPGVAEEAEEAVVAEAASVGTESEI